MVFPQKAMVGSTYQDDPPSEREITAVRLAQNVLRQVGMDFAADLLEIQLSRPVYICEQAGWWSLKSDQIANAKEAAKQL